MRGAGGAISESVAVGGGSQAGRRREEKARCSGPGLDRGARGTGIGCCFNTPGADPEMRAPRSSAVRWPWVRLKGARPCEGAGRGDGASSRTFCAERRRRAASRPKRRARGVGGTVPTRSAHGPQASGVRSVSLLQVDRGSWRSEGEPDKGSTPAFYTGIGNCTG